MTRSAKVTFLPEGTVFTAQVGETLARVCFRAGRDLQTRCGGVGKCGKCAVKTDRGTVLACQTKITGDITCEVPIKKEEITLRRYAPTPTSYGAAVDLGTTTIVCRIIDLTDGSTAAEASCLNPQTRFAADVIGRIGYADSFGTADMRALAVNSLRNLLKAAEAESPERCVIVGNTCMTQIIAGLPVSGLGQVPHEPAFFDKIIDTRIVPDCETLIMPPIAGFVGSDTSSLLTVTAEEDGKTRLIIDIGTNAEVALAKGDEIYVCSSAAGPAFEGAEISAGMRAAAGAIYNVKITDGKPEVKTIDGAAAAGICGSGMISALRAMARAEIISPSGRLQEPYELAKDVFITPTDVRKLQLAKAAVRAAAETLIRTTGKRPEEILLAGAFGSSINPEDAKAIGLIPDLPAKSVGNGAGDGAALMVYDSRQIRRALDISKRADHIELAASPDYTDLLTEYMFF